jgi:dTMP kinase
MFLVFEGIDGSGKSTQAKLLAEHLRTQRGADVVLVREPGGTELGEKVRSLVLDGEDLSAETELFLFMAARSHLARTRILPALEKGQVVISDRFIWSSAVYQGIVAGNDFREILRMGRLAAPGLSVSKTFLIDVDPRASFGRVKDRNRMEAKGLDFQKRVRAGFLALAKQARGKVAVIDGRGTVDEVHARVLANLPTRGWPACSSR